MNIINTNARSIRPKIKSFVQCLINLSITFAIISETWLAHGSRLENDTEHLLLGHGLATFYLNRPLSPNGVAHGGVAVVMRASLASGKPFLFPNPENFEVLPIAANLFAADRKFYIVAAYIPPNYTVVRGRACLKHVSDLILEIKRRATNPYIVVAGDFNQWPVSEALVDYPELVEVSTPPTRDDRHIDKIFTNWNDDIYDSGCVPPLQTEGSADTRTYSDHNIQYLCSKIPRKVPIKWETYSYRPFTDLGADAFVEELAGMNWDSLYSLHNSNDAAILLQRVLDDMMDKHFPTKTCRKKDTDLPWFNDTARKMVKKKNAIYNAEGQSERWRRQADKIERYLSRGQQTFLQNQRSKLTGPDASKNFFKNIRAFKGVDKPKEFNICDLRPGKPEGEVAEEAASFFNRISAEFEPLEPSDIPSTYHRDLPLLSPADVEKMLKDAKKSGSMVKGDIFPKMINRCSPYLAWPLSYIYNLITRSYLWPIHWKREFVTIIPKKTTPGDFSDMRNISCTLFISKVYEQFVLRCLQEETSLKDNQFGGVKGCSTTHMVVELLQEICENAEDYRSATVICAIDYSKAFNRMSFQHCLDALRKKNASTPVINLVATFLSNRTMTVRVGSSWSEPLPVSGGCPQGSILGVSLFNNTTEFLEDDFLLFEQRRLGLLHGREGFPPGGPGTGPPPAEIPPTISTPERGEVPALLTPLSPILQRPDEQEQYIPTIRLKTVPQPVLQLPPIDEKIGTQVLINKAVKIAKYVDDNITVEKLNFGPVEETVSGGFRIKLRLAVNTQNAFRSIKTKAEEIGMVVNSSKTKLLTISDALHYRPKAFIFDTDGTKIESGTSMNLLGFHLSDRPGVHAHVDHTVKKMRLRYWTLYHLRRVGFTSAELVSVYKSMILPLADYCCPAYHSLLTDQHDQELERTQIGALRSIFGYQLTATQLRQEAGVETLRERRIRLTDNFAQKCLKSERFRKWFPETELRRSGRQSERYKEFFAKTDRLKNSPLYYMRRRLNGKAGKIYGERNKKYRENFGID